jgi:hypothetical protein
MNITSRTTEYILLLTIALGVFSVALAEETYLVSPIVSYAEYDSIRFNNENWNTLPHPKVAEFTIREDGSAYGLTENGIPFYQYNVPNDIGVRVQRFEIQDHYHYIVEGEIANTLSELSARLALAYESRIGA